MRRFLLSLLAGLLIATNVGLSPTVAVGETIDLTKPSQYLLGICKTATQLDCLEPEIFVKHQDGSISVAQLVSSDVTSPFVENVDLGIAGMHRFKVASGNSNGASREFFVRPVLNTPASNPIGSVEVRISNLGKKLKSNECNEALSKLCARFTLDPEDQFKVTVRSQKFPTHWTGATAQDGDILHEDFLDGDKWILSGAQTRVGWNPGFSWIIAAVGPDNGSKFFKDIPFCSQYGVLFRSSNGTTGGLPSWNSKTKSLNFGVFGPHLDANGDLFRGFFKARIPKKWLDCVYPENTLSMAEQLVVNITYDDGSVQVATTHTKISENIIYIDVPVLHFSSPTIRISNAALVAKASPKPTVKTVNCVKGKIKKKVVASKCPTGWKLVA